MRRTLRNRARYEVANNSYAKGIVLTLANDVVGTGPRLQMLTDDPRANRLIEREFSKWASTVCVPEKLRTMRMARAESGEAFLLLTDNPGLDASVQLDLRLIEADQVTTPDMLLGKPNAEDGIVFDDHGNVVEYHVLKDHPGSPKTMSLEDGYDRIPAESMVHYYRGDRPGQSRGIPDITSVIGQGAQVELLYTIRGTTDDIAAKQALVDESPEEYDGLPRLSAEIEPVGIAGDPGSSGTDGKPNVWDGTVRYGLVDDNAPQVGESSFSFDTGGGTQHITQSLGTVGVHAAPGSTAPHFGGAIGVTDTSVEGVDIIVPVYNFAETHYLPASMVTPAYRQTLFQLTGRVNNAPFKGTASGECLFLGAAGSKRGISGGEDWEITFRFAASPNQTNLVVGDITGISKGGWEYLWVRYQDVEDSSAKALVKRPLAVYVERVYHFGNFSGLGIGT